MPSLVTKIISCPYCRGRVSVYAKQCPTCSEDLSLLSDLQLLPYELYNQGRERFLAADHYGALLKLAAAVELGKDFEEARLLLAKVAGVLGLQESAGNGTELTEGDVGAASDTSEGTTAVKDAPSDEVGQQENDPEAIDL